MVMVTRLTDKSNALMTKLKADRAANNLFTQKQSPFRTVDFKHIYKTAQWALSVIELELMWKLEECLLRIDQN